MVFAYFLSVEIPIHFRWDFTRSKKNGTQLLRRNYLVCAPDNLYFLQTRDQGRHLFFYRYLISFLSSESWCQTYIDDGMQWWFTKESCIQCVGRRSKDSLYASHHQCTFESSTPSWGKILKICKKINNVRKVLFAKSIGCLGRKPSNCNEKIAFCFFLLLATEDRIQESGMGSPLTGHRSRCHDSNRGSWR